MLLALYLFSYQEAKVKKIKVTCIRLPGSKVSKDDDDSGNDAK